MYRTLEVCSNRGGFETVPDPPRPVDLVDARHRLETAGIAVVDARVMLIAALEAEVTISRNGRLLFKTGDRALAERTLDHLSRLLGFSDLEPSERPTDRAPKRRG